ncbi:MAG TPA: hypothetical protein VEH48_01215 [Candidatus Nitrosopolaris sp.]|nr:hypothetical protein [Candidatus Nitrosopolaris sp.]
MYKSVEAKEYKKHFEMPEDYRIDGVLISGTWQVDREFERVEQLLKQSHPSAKIQPIPYRFVSIGREITTDKGRYWVFVMYGGAMLSEFLHLGSLFGSKKNILVGLAGGLKPGIKMADIILPSASFKDGSMSTMYDPSDNELVHADKGLTSSLKTRLDPKLAIHEGKTMTCQAMMGESAEDVKKWSTAGYLAVEMEAATVFAVSKHFKVPAAAVLSIADNLIEEETVMHEKYEALAEIRSNVRNEQYRIALDELLAGNT